ncbi:MAG: lipid A deacylase LpxR family protein, partial [Caulobacteraceae bacterium]|nr:lipid A deacylase LpxR family protein [Caulobacteraceae bacterium]
MISRFAHACLTAALAGLLPGAAAAQDSPRAAPIAPAPAVITGITENDLYAPDNRDRHYTNGLRFGWISADDQEPQWARSLTDQLPLLDPTAAHRIGWTLAQSMFTPQDKATSAPVPRDRPYAAWLYGGLKLQTERPDRLDTVELDVGMVGPAALGQQVQDDWHQLIGVSGANGWSHQIKNEPGLDLMLERLWRVPLTTGADDGDGTGVDLVPNAVGSLGNVFTYGGGGMTVRFGNDLQADFGPPRISPAVPGSDSFHPRQGFGWYVFAGAGGRAVLRNITLDGNTFSDSQSVRKRPLVADLYGGAAFMYDNARLAYTLTARSKEFY